MKKFNNDRQTMDLIYGTGFFDFFSRQPDKRGPFLAKKFNPFFNRDSRIIYYAGTDGFDWMMCSKLPVGCTIKRREMTQESAKKELIELVDGWLSLKAKSDDPFTESRPLVVAVIGDMFGDFMASKLYYNEVKPMSLQYKGLVKANCSIKEWLCV